MASKTLTYGTELVYNKETVYFAWFNFSTGNYLCYKKKDYFPEHFYLQREDFTIKKLKEKKFISIKDFKVVVDFSKVEKGLF